MKNYPGGRPKQKLRIAVSAYYEELVNDNFCFKNRQGPLGHNLLAPLVELFEFGEMNNIEFVGVTSKDYDKLGIKYDAWMFLDYPEEIDFYNQVFEKNIKKILLIGEPKIIRPQNWCPKNHCKFDAVFTWDDDLVDNGKFQKLFPTISLGEHSCDIAGERLNENLLVQISSAKISEAPGELYSQRINAINYFTNRFPERFRFFGKGWPEFTSYGGEIKNKLEVLGKFKFSLVFENSMDQNGYITEKILDCFLCGVIPIYWGAPNISRWIPKECYIDFGDFDHSFQRVAAYIEEMSDNDCQNFRNQIKNFLNSPGIYPFSVDNFIQKVTCKLVELCEKKVDLGICIPVYNSEKYIEECINSVLANVLGLEGIEIDVVVVDNCSSDESYEKIASCSEKNEGIRYYRQSRNWGGRINWESVVAINNANHVLILCSDDFLLPKFLSRISRFIQEDVDVIYSRLLFVNENSVPIQISEHPGYPEPTDSERRNEFKFLIGRDNFLTPSATVFKKKYWSLIGEEPRLKVALDWLLALTISLQTCNFKFINLPYVCYRIHCEQDTAKNLNNNAFLSDHIELLDYLLARHIDAFDVDISQDALNLLSLRFRNSNLLTVNSTISVPKLQYGVETLTRLSGIGGKP
jgi:glycosyltransferase involved in cell wall biosynthesis